MSKNGGNLDVHGFILTIDEDGLHNQRTSLHKNFMRTSVEFLRAETSFQGPSFFDKAERCNSCNDPVNEMFEYQCEDPDYRRTFHICKSCHEKVQS